MPRNKPIAKSNQPVSKGRTKPTPINRARSKAARSATNPEIEELFRETGKTPTTAWEYESPDDHAEEELAS